MDSQVSLPLTCPDADDENSGFWTPLRSTADHPWMYDGVESTPILNSTSSSSSQALQGCATPVAELAGPSVTLSAPKKPRRRLCFKQAPNSPPCAQLSGVLSVVESSGNVAEEDGCTQYSGSDHRRLYKVFHTSFRRWLERQQREDACAVAQPPTWETFVKADTLTRNSMLVEWEMSSTPTASLRDWATEYWGSGKGSVATFCTRPSGA